MLLRSPNQQRQSTEGVRNVKRKETKAEIGLLCVGAFAGLR